MIEQTGSDAIGHHGLTVEGEFNELGENQPLEKLTEDQNQKHSKKPRRFSYQSGSTVLTGYTIKRGIGIGGFGEVYFGISDAGKEVALKRIQRNLDVELRGVSQCLNLKHLNLIALWDIRQDTEGESWVVMEYVPGNSLRDVLEKNPQGISIEDAKTWFNQILDGVSYLHDHGIVHRDLKPGNIFYDQDEDVVKIGDYGLSKFISTSKRDGQTESVGTFHYMAPEIGKGSYGKEIDIYSLGIILCEILSGRVPFDGESGQEIIMKHLTANPEIDFIEPRFRPVIQRALSKDPAERFASVQEMMDSIDWHGDGSVKSPGPAANDARESKTAQQKSLIEPMFIREDMAVDQGDSGKTASDDLLYIGDEEIRFGEVQQFQKRSAKTEDWSESEDGSMRMSQVKPAVQPPIPVVADRPTKGLAKGDVVSSTFNQGNEPIAAAVGSGYQKVAHWWNGIEATPIKVLLVVGLALFVLFNAQLLIPLSIGLGCVYMIYYLFRTQVSNRETGSTNHSATTIRPFSRKECLNLVEQKMRESRLRLPFVEKLTEGLGSVLSATFVIAVSTLVGLGFSGFSLDGSVATFAVFTWLSLTSVVGTVVCIASTKILETELGNQWKRRFVLMTLGLLVGALSFVIYQSFLIGSVAFPEQVSRLEEFGWMTQGETGLMRFLTFFAGLFLVIRWWKVGDALRSAQFSVMVMVLHVILAVGLALVTSFPVIWALIIGGTMSIAVQLSSTWIKSQEREKIQYEVMQSISA